MTFPLTMRALELGNSFVMLGGRPISIALSNSFDLIADIRDLLLRIDD
jgi:hypothetical protein